VNRHPSPIHAKPVDAAGRHVPSVSCSCGVILAADMAEPGRVVYVHRHAIWPRDDAPPDPAPETRPSCTCAACAAFDDAAAEHRAGRTPGTAERLALASERRDTRHRLGRRDPDDRDGAA